jgi:hypothetical protein
LTLTHFPRTDDPRVVPFSLPSIDLNQELGQLLENPCTIPISPDAIHRYNLNPIPNSVTLAAASPTLELAILNLLAPIEKLEGEAGQWVPYEAGVLNLFHALGVADTGQVDRSGPSNSESASRGTAEVVRMNNEEVKTPNEELQYKRARHDFSILFHRLEIYMQEDKYNHRDFMAAKTQLQRNRWLPHVARLAWRVGGIGAGTELVLFKMTRAGNPPDGDPNALSDVQEAIRCDLSSQQGRWKAVVAFVQMAAIFKAQAELVERAREESPMDGLLRCGWPMHIPCGVRVWHHVLCEQVLTPSATWIKKLCQKQARPTSSVWVYPTHVHKIYRDDATVERLKQFYTDCSDISGLERSGGLVSHPPENRSAFDLRPVGVPPGSFAEEPRSVCLDLVKDVLTTLACIHAKGWTHLDVRPPNLVRVYKVSN